MKVSFGWRGDTDGLERLTVSETKIDEYVNYVFNFTLQKLLN